MGLITQEVEVGLGGNNIKHFESLGYKIPKRKDKWGSISVPRNTKILVKVEDLPKGSNAYVKIKCDGVNCENELLIKWQDYLKCVKENDIYYCVKCIRNNGVFLSFEQWCIENNRQDVLDRWDYQLNNCQPNEINYATKKQYYFKCSRNLHESELKNINHFTNGQEGSINCKTCNSFAQWGIDNLGEDFLDKYWDYEKNIVNPWKIAKAANKPKVWIKCQEKDYHGSYDISCYGFLFDGNRCAFCTNRNGKIHPLASLGTSHPEVLEIWSDRNKKSPYEYAPYANQDVYWKCPEKKHDDYNRRISVSTSYDFRCPECQYSKGEDKISSCLIDKRFIKLFQEDFEQIIDENKYNKNYYIPQMKFDGLVGLGGKLLSYDFYIPKYNFLVEYQGEFHDGNVGKNAQSIKQLQKQQEHDKRKREYAKKHNIKLLEIWYYDFDKIEEILSNYLKDIM